MEKQTNQIKQGSTRQIAADIFNIMKGHVGQNNGIDRDELFKQVFGKNRKQFNQFQQFTLNLLLLRVIHYLRVRSNCFIASKHVNKSRVYFVLKDLKDLEVYRTQTNNNIAGIRSMQRRADNSVRESWHKKDWDFDQ